LHGELQIEVRASIDKFGRVSNIQPLSSAADSRLVRLVTEAVSRASFYPAQSNGHDVNSKLVLTFHFSGPNVTRASGAEGR
jgi:TonB family protein